MQERDPQAQSSTKQTTVHHFRLLHEKFRDRTPQEGDPDYEEYCTYLALTLVEAKRASRPPGGGFAF